MHEGRHHQSIVDGGEVMWSSNRRSSRDSLRLATCPSGVAATPVSLLRSPLTASVAFCAFPFMVGVAQLVRAPDCGSGGRGFETRHPPHNLRVFRNTNFYRAVN